MAQPYLSAIASATIRRSGQQILHYLTPNDEEMNVFFLLDNLRVGGAERHTINLSEALARASINSHIIIYGPVVSEQFARERMPPRTTHLNITTILNIRGWILLGHTLKSANADIVIAVNQTALVLALFTRWLGLHKANVICVFHTTVITGYKRIMLLPVFRFALRHAEAIVYVSENQARYWASRNLRAKTSEIITNGIDVSLWLPMSALERTTARARLGFQEPDVVAVLCARFYPEKSHNLLVEACARLSAIGAPLKLLFVGDGPTRPPVRALVENLSLTDAVVFAGEQGDVRQYIGAGDIGVICSTSVETFSLAALELMAMQMPVVMSDIGGVSEIVEPSYNGYLFSAGDVDGLVTSLSRLMRPDARVRLGEAARRSVELRHSWSSMVEKYRKLIARWGGHESSDAQLSDEGGLI